MKAICLLLLLPLPAAGAPPAAAPFLRCTSVTAGTAEAYACLNNEARDLVARQRAQLGASVPNATSPAPSLGLYNQAATREQYGGNFGHSATPFRPGPEIYANPLLPH